MKVSRPTEQDKLSLNWEGPYQVVEVLHHGAYRIAELDETQIPRTWNAESLQIYYQ